MRHPVSHGVVPWTRLATIAALAFILAGVLLALGGILSAGEAQSWDVAEAFAADSTRPVRRAGMLLGVVGLATLVAATPGLVARLGVRPAPCGRRSAGSGSRCAQSSSPWHWAWPRSSCPPWASSRVRARRRPRRWPTG